jgi:hypothetical protein
MNNSFDALVSQQRRKGQRAKSEGQRAKCEESNDFLYSLAMQIA